MVQHPAMPRPPTKRLRTLIGPISAPSDHRTSSQPMAEFRHLGVPGSASRSRGPEFLPSAPQCDKAPADFCASSWQSPTLLATTNSILGSLPTVSSFTSVYDSSLCTVMTVLTGPI